MANQCIYGIFNIPTWGKSNNVKLWGKYSSICTSKINLLFKHVNLLIFKLIPCKKLLTVYRNIYAPVLFLPFLPSFSAGDFKIGQIQNNSLLTVLIRKCIYFYNCVMANSRWGKTIKSKCSSPVRSSGKHREL